MYSVYFVKKNEYKDMGETQLVQEFNDIDLDILKHFDVVEIMLNTYTHGNVIISKVEDSK